MGMKEMPKAASFLALDLGGVLGPFFFTIAMNLLFPAIVVAMVSVGSGGVSCHVHDTYLPVFVHKCIRAERKREVRGEPGTDSKHACRCTRRR